MIHSNGSKPPAHLPGNMKPPSKPSTPSEAMGRSGGAPGKQIPDEVTRTKVSKSSLTQKMP